MRPAAIVTKVMVYGELLQTVGTFTDQRLAALAEARPRGCNTSARGANVFAGLGHIKLPVDDQDGSC